jgi:hypothetical protein
MDAECLLDDGALRRLWHGPRAIVPDATVEKIHDFFHQRAMTVYRNRVSFQQPCVNPFDQAFF